MASKGFKASPVGIGAAAAVLAAAALAALAPIPVLEVVHADGGRLLWRLPVRDGSRVRLHYVNSLYHAPTTEEFAVTADGLRLVEVTTTAEAVMEYLRIDPPYRVVHGRLAADTSGPTVPALVTRIGQTGRQWLEVDDRSLPLYRVGVGEAVRIRVVRRPRAVAQLYPFPELPKTP